MNKRLLSLLLAWAVASPVFAESFTTNVIDGIATNITGEFILGDTGPHNFLLITNGGAMTNLDRVFIGNTVEAHNNTALIVGTGSVWDLDQILYLGSESASNVLAIRDGAFVGLSQPLAIGTRATASNNLLHVAGPGSRLAAPYLYLGTYGADNQLLAEDGAYLNVPSFTFNSEGRSDGGRQTAVFRGAGTVLSTSGSLRMGNSPANTLQILAGAEAVIGNSTIGAGRSPANKVVVSGAGSRWKNTFSVMIGDFLSPSNEVLITERGAAQAAGLTLGQRSSDNSYALESAAYLDASQIMIGAEQSAVRNHLLVTGAGTTLSNRVALVVGQSGSENSFVLSDQAFAAFGDFSLGMQFTSSNNHAAARDTNTLWIANRLTVGGAGDFNSLIIDNGARLFASSLLSGGQGGSGNSTCVSGRGSLLSLTNALDLSGGNSLLVTNNGRVESGSGVIGSYGPGNVALLKDGSWSNVNSLVVGSQAADNSLYASNVARLYASNFLVGAADNADGNRVHVSGKGTSLRLANALQLGSWGDSNQFFIGNGAAVSAAQLHVGGFVLAGGPVPASFPADANTLMIDGSTTLVTVTSNISVGYNGSHNRIEVRGGADLTSTSIEVGTGANSTNNTILVTDPGTHWRNTNTLLLGSNGYRNSLIVSNGARLSTGPLMIGAGGLRVPVSTFCTNRIGWNELVVTDDGSLLEVGGRVPFSTASLSNSVVVTRGGALRMDGISLSSGGCASESSNQLLVDGGALIVTNSFYLARGFFRLLSGRAEINSVFVEGGPPGRCQVLGGILRVGSIYASAPAQAEIGDGIHRATLELTGPNNFSSGRIAIASNSVLAGRSSIFGFTNSGVYGTVRAVTALTNVSLAGSGGFNVWIQGVGPGTGHSMLHLSAQNSVVTGRLVVAISRAFVPQPGDAFPIVIGAGAGTFENAPNNSRVNTVDNLGSFRIQYGSTIVLTDYRSTDLDGDSIEDRWATNYFGHSPLTSAERSIDSDGDGMSNYGEFRAGTDPTNAASALRVTAASAAEVVRLRWSSVDGKTYRIYSSNDLQTWSQIPEPTLAFPEPGLCQWTDTGTDAGSPTGQMRFYRIAVE